MKATEFLKKMQELDLESLENTKGLGPVLISNLQEFLASKRYQTLLEKFGDLETKNKGLEIIAEQAASNNLPLSGQKICITGTFEISRNEIKEKLEVLGAEVVNTVSKNTTILLAGQEAGSKLQKAIELGVRVETGLDILI